MGVRQVIPECEMVCSSSIGASTCAADVPNPYGAATGLPADGTGSPTKLLTDVSSAVLVRSA